MDSSVVLQVYTSEDTGKAQYIDYVTDRLTLCHKPVTDTISKNKFSLFKAPSKKAQSRSKQQVASLKANSTLFSRLFIACQARSGNLSEFFKYENQACPPSLSNMGDMRHGTKADLLDLLQKTSARRSCCG